MTITSIDATMKLATSQSTQGTVSSIDTFAILQETIRLTAIGGVNCPIATAIVRITPNQTTSHLNSCTTGASSGMNIRNIDTPSRNMPTTSRIANSSSSAPVLPRPLSAM